MTSPNRKRRDRAKRRELQLDVDEMISPNDSGKTGSPDDDNKLGAFENLRRADLSVIRCAIRGNWAVSLASKQNVAAALEKAAQSEHSNVVVAVAKVVLMMSEANRQGAGAAAIDVVSDPIENETA